MHRAHGLQWIWDGNSELASERCNVNAILRVTPFALAVACMASCTARANPVEAWSEERRAILNRAADLIGAIDEGDQHELFGKLKVVSEEFERNKQKGQALKAANKISWEEAMRTNKENTSSSTKRLIETYDRSVGSRTHERISALALVRWLDDNTLRLCRIDIESIDSGVNVYRCMFGRNPRTLDEYFDWLANSNPAIKRPDGRDPWGRPWKYSLDGPRNDGRKPDIWSDGPRFWPEDRKVGNWEKLPESPEG